MVKRFKKVLLLPDFKVSCVDFTHNQTGSIYLNIDNSVRYDDGNNVFLVSFNTQLINNTGDPNILEYISLRGFQ